MILMNMQKKAMIITLFILIAFYGAGILTGVNIPSQSNVEDLSISDEVYITSISDGDIVHSVVPIDASNVVTEIVMVLLNGTLLANYLPYFWNNIHYPAGSYNITVRVKLRDAIKAGQWVQDTRIVTIPEEFIVPTNYNFTEDFVVHYGQTVWFEDYNWTVASAFYGNGLNDYNERTMLSINIYGNLIIDNATLECGWFIAEDYSNTTIINNGTVIAINSEKVVYPSGYVSTLSGMRFDDYAILNYDATISVLSITTLQATPEHPIDNIVVFDNGMQIAFFEQSNWTLI